MKKLKLINAINMWTFILFTALRLASSIEHGLNDFSFESIKSNCYNGTQRIDTTLFNITGYSPNPYSCSRKDRLICCELLTNGIYTFQTDNLQYKDAINQLFIYVKDSARLYFNRFSFNNTRFNHISIVGQGTIEFQEEADIGNRAPHPEINILNCDSFVMKSKAFHGEKMLKVNNCSSVIIYKGAIDDTNITANFKNIRDLNIYDGAMSVQAMAKIYIHDSKIRSLNRFGGKLREIKFYNSAINSVESTTFNNLYIDSIIFEKCEIGEFKTDAIMSQAHIKYFAILQSTVKKFETNSINGSGIEEFLLKNNNITEVDEKAIHFISINSSISHNNIDYAKEKWLQASQYSRIVIDNNKFGHFHALVLEYPIDHSVCIFSGNYITNAKQDCLSFINNKCEIRETFFSNACTCNTTWLNLFAPNRDLRPSSFCSIDRTLEMCLKTKLINVIKYYDMVCDESKTKLDCIEGIKNNKKIEGKFLQPEDLNKQNLPVDLIAIAVASFILLSILIAITVIIAYRCRKHRPPSLLLPSTPTTRTATTAPRDSPGFSHHDRCIINQTLEKIQQKYLPFMYEHIKEKVEILLGGNLSEKQRVDTIGDIIELIQSCQNASDDFVAFNDIMYRHLEPHRETSEDEPRYEELPNVPHSTNPPNGTANEEMHIYSEPNNAQEPLLISEYSNPLDRNEAAIYAEPLSCRNEDEISPYGVSGLTRFNANQERPKPSITKNLPDVLSRPGPATKSKKPVIIREPLYAISKKTLIRDPLKSDNDSAMGGRNTAGDSRSNHSGGSDSTMRMDDVIEYADAYP